MSKFNISLKDTFVVLMIVAVLLGWYVDRKSLLTTNESLRMRSVMMSSDYGVRRKFVTRIGKEPEEHIGALLFMLTDPDAFIRKSALRSLENVDPKKFSTARNQELLKFLELLKQANVPHVHDFLSSGTESE